MSDFWIPQQDAILTRLRAKFPASVAVTEVAELTDVPDLRQKSPALFVVYEGFDPTTGPINGQRVQQLTLTWAIAIATQSSKGAGQTQAAARLNSTLAFQVISALLGYPVAPASFLKIAPSARPEFDAGFCYSAIRFTSAHTFRGDPA